jgi:5'-nucleotidase
VAMERPSRWIVHGTPADCVRVALHGLASDVAWVLAGINHGGNLGADVFHSGTVAAVREAVLHGTPGIAFSQYHKRNQTIDWNVAARWVAQLLPELMAKPASPGIMWNVNLPHLEPGAPEPEVVYCPLDVSPLPLSFRREGELHFYNGDYHGRPRVTGSDVDACFSGKIAVTRLVLA